MKTFNIENEPKIASGFKVPDNYFENFSNDLIPKLPEKQIKVISIFKIQKKWAYAVAAVLILSISVPTVNRIINNNPKIDDITLENYIAYHSTISDNDVVDLLNAEDIKKIKVDLKIDTEAIETEISTNEISEQELID